MRDSACRRGGMLNHHARLCALGWVVCVAIGVAIPANAQTTLPLVLPSAIAFDAQGSLYIADAGGHVVRKLSAGGAVTTVAGNGVQGYAGDSGLAIAAELDSPAGLAVDAGGNLYIADSHNHRVREVGAATGVITTIAGTGVAGFSGDGGLAKGAELDLPTALALDSAGNLYVADTDNHRIRRIAAATGVITTVVGNGVEGYGGDNGLATAASIDSPNGLTVDATGNLYLADTHNGRVREVSAATGLISTVAAAGLAVPRGLTTDVAGNVYVADSANHRVRRISPSGAIATVAGEGTETYAGDDAPAVAASLDTPRSVAVSPAGLVTLADGGNRRVRQIDALAVPDIHTLPWVGSTSPGTLTLSGQSVFVYGSGTITATLSAATVATGSVSFLDANAGTSVTLGTANLSATDIATFSAGALGVGTHSIVAVYSGDVTHGAAQSPALSIAITPLTVVATAKPAAILYGQSVPTLGGDAEWCVGTGQRQGDGGVHDQRWCAVCRGDLSDRGDAYGER
jgi:sugar lactone lactonase YvrE